MDVEPSVLAEPDTSDADSLISTNIPDEMDGEQTWPTEEEMANAPANGMSFGESIPDAKAGTTPKSLTRTRGKMVKVPKGWSSYQAAWIVDDDDGEDEGEEVLDGEDVEMGGGVDGSVDGVAGNGSIEEEEGEEFEEVEMEGRKGVEFEDLDADEENKQ